MPKVCAFRVADCAKHSFAGVRHFLREPFHKFVDVFALGVLVRGARVVQDGQIQFVDRAFDVRFACVNKRAYQRYAASVHKRYGLESRKPAFVQKRQQHSLHDVVGVMSEGEFIESQLDRLIVKRATARTDCTDCFLSLPRR